MAPKATVLLPLRRVVSRSLLLLANCSLMVMLSLLVMRRSRLELLIRCSWIGSLLRARLQTAPPADALIWLSASALMLLARFFAKACGLSAA